MNFSEENIILILVASLTAVLSYMFIRRAFWKDEAIKEATESLNKEKNSNVHVKKDEDITEVSDYIGQSTIVLGILTVLFWAILIYLLNEFKK
jgi:hypothetical protein